MDFTETLLAWYMEHRRELPWQSGKNPYYIWVSEIILQQTRVSQGLEYYHRFIASFPTVQDLARAKEDEVLKVWQGLGYYSRARNMHRTAQTVADSYGGIFPREVDQLKKLRGIGPYTAAAVASFAFNRPVAALDGNGYRILARFFGLDLSPNSATGKRKFAELAENLLPPDNSARFNQALMDFGSLVCMPRPDCVQCPLQEACRAYNTNTVLLLPAGKTKTSIRNRYFNYLDLEWNGKTFIGQRKEKDIWRGLYEFPLIETSCRADMEQLIAHGRFKEIIQDDSFVLLKTWEPEIHKLSHRNISAVFFRIKIQNISASLQNDYLCIQREALTEYAVSRLTEKYLNFLHIFADL